MGDGLFSGKKLICTTNELYDMYVLNQLDQRVLAKELNITIYSLLKLLNCAGISRRTPSEVSKKQYEDIRNKRDPDFIYYDDRVLCHEQELIDLYWREELSVTDLSKKFSIPVSSMGKILYRNNIPTRNFSEVKTLMNKRLKEQQNPNILYKHNKIAICSIDEFKKLYYGDFLNLEQIAKKFNIAESTLKYKLKLAGIKPRTFKENGKVVSDKHKVEPIFPMRENSVHWKGGEIYRDGYKFSFDPKSSLANSVGYVNEHRRIMAEKLGRKLNSGETVHHIDFVRTNNVIDNLYLCPSMSHHSQIHSQTKEILCELYNLQVLIFENGKYVVNKKMIDKLHEISEVKP